MTSEWSPVIDQSLSKKVLAAVHDVARRMSDSDRVSHAVAVGVAQTGQPEYWGWSPSSLGRGDVGLALFYGYYGTCFPQHNWDRVAHFYLSRAVNAINEHPNQPIGMFGGLSGLAFAAMQLSRHGQRYRRLLANLDEILITSIDDTVNSLSDPSDLSKSSYDLISGATGLAVYLLCRLDEPSLAPTRGKVLDYLLSLTCIDETNNLICYVPPENLPTKRDQVQYPYGCTDCGLAHGIPGIVSILSLAQLNGISRPGLLERLRSVTQWLVDQRVEDEYGANWPYVVEPLQSPTNYDKRMSRIAWCYGIPGIARSLYLAGRALEDDSIRGFAMTALENVAYRPSDRRGIISPTFCHGLAGVLQVTCRMYDDTHQPAFAEYIRKITKELLDYYEPEGILGFREVEPDGRQIESPGLLEGVAGVALALLAAVHPTVPTWDRAFLLS